MSRRTGAPRKRGVILIIVLVVIVVLALAAYTFCDLMVTHKESAQLSGKQIQARNLSESGAEAVRIFLAQPRAMRQEAGGVYDNSNLFRGIVVRPDSDPKMRGAFSVLAPELDSSGNAAGVRYGLEDESARLNLNILVVADKQLPGSGRTLLMALPGMTEDVADAIMDWLDPDDEPCSENGAEVDYYSGLTPPYAPKNGPLETVEELLLVRGVTPQLLFGLDSNRNGTIDAHEQGGGAAPTATSAASASSSAVGSDSLGSEGNSDLGWSAFLTLYSQERNVDSEGNPRVYLNQEDMTQLHTELSAACGDEWANFIVAYRQFGPYSGMEATVSASAATLDLTRAANTQITQVLDLIGQKTQVPGADGEAAKVLASPFAQESMGVFLPQLMDKCTTVQSEFIPGRVNINQAPRAVLMGIPGANETIVSAILENRQANNDGSNPNHNFETWLLAEAIVTLDEMRTLLPFINAGGDVFRAQVVGYFQGGGPACRVEVVFDATAAEPRILFLRDISHLGRGYALETLGVDFSEQP